MRKGSIIAGSVAVAAVGSTALGGIALAGNHYHADSKSGHSHSKHYKHGGSDYARGGDGGKATNNCINVGIPVLSGIGVGGEGKATGASCSASADGGDAAAY